MELIICDADKEECTLIKQYVIKHVQKDVHIRVCEDWQGLYDFIMKKEADVLIIALRGVEGLDVLSSLKTPIKKRIWFSDLDFSVQAYRMSISYFNVLPITQQKLRDAFYNI